MKNEEFLKNLCTYKAIELLSKGAYTYHGLFFLFYHCQLTLPTRKNLWHDIRCVKSKHEHMICIMISKCVWISYTIQEVAMPQHKEHTDFCWWWQMWSNPTQVHRNAQCVHHWDLCRGLCLANQRLCSRVQKSPPCLWFVRPAICSPCPGWCSPRGCKEVVQHIAHGSHRCLTRRKAQEGRMRETTRAPPQSEPTARVIAPFCW